MKIKPSHREILEEFQFFDIILADTYFVTAVNVFVYRGEIEMVFTMRSKEVDLLLTGYATITKELKCVCRSELITEHYINMSSSAKEEIRKKLEPLSLSIASDLLTAGVGEYGNFSFNRDSKRIGFV